MEANVNETRAEWPADGMATLIFPNGLRKIYRKLKDPKEQDAVMSWLGRYILTGEDRENYKVQEYLKILLKDEVSRIFGKQKACSANAEKRWRAKNAKTMPAESKADANPMPTECQTDASGMPSGCKEKGKGKSKVGGKPPTTPSTLTSRGCAGAREGEDEDEDRDWPAAWSSPPALCSGEGGEPAPAAPVESAEAEAKRLGFGQYAPVAGELRELMGVRAETMAATVYMAADGKGMSAEELLGWARHRQRQGWRTGQGGGVLITRHNVASDIAIWAKNQANFQRAGAAGGAGSARPAAARQEGGAPDAEEGRKAPKRKWKFEKAVMDEDRGRYVWGLPEDALAEFAAWFCGEEGNERAVGFYGRFIAANGASAFRRELDKFTGSIASGEEPENRGAAFTAALKEI